MTYTIRSDEPIKATFCENDEVKSVLQNLALLFTTRKGTIPMYRDFGLNGEFKDKPIEVAKTLLAAEITEAMESFEPRANLVSVDFETSEHGKLIIIVEVDI